MNNKHGKLIVLCGKSGTGKTSIEHMLWNLGLKRVISYTTREKRNNEINNIDYHFITKNKFNKMINDKKFIEYNIFNNDLYGTTYDSINLSKGHTVCVVEPNGYKSLLNYFGEDNVIMVYIYIENHERLIRLLNRSKDVENSINKYNSDETLFNEIYNESLYKIKNIDIKTSALTIANLILKMHL